MKWNKNLSHQDISSPASHPGADLEKSHGSRRNEVIPGSLSDLQETSPDTSFPQRKWTFVPGNVPNHPQEQKIYSNLPLGLRIP